MPEPLFPFQADNHQPELAKNPAGPLRAEILEALDQSLTNEFFDQFESEIEKELRLIDEQKDLKTTPEKEKAFATEVIQAYLKWSKEDNAVVLWDLDETIGWSGLRDGKWVNRHSSVYLLQFLRLKFPRVKNGILSSRSSKGIKNEFGLGDNSSQKVSEMQKLREFFDDSFIFSSRENQTGQGEEFNEILNELSEKYPGKNDGFYRKAAILIYLKRKGVNVKSIDDLEGMSEIFTEAISMAKMKPVIFD